MKLQILIIHLILLLLLPSVAFAQGNEIVFFYVLRVDTAKPPMVDLWLYGDGLKKHLSTAKIKITENDKAQNIIGDLLEQSAIQMGVVIDPWQINDNGVGGQSSRINVATILRSLAEKSVSKQLLVRGQDQLAAYSILPNDALQIIQDWTDEPNLLHNSVFLTPIGAAARKDQLTTLLMQSMAKFEMAKFEPGRDSASGHNVVKTILLFANSASQVDLAQVVAQAKAQEIHIHVINLSGEVADSGALQQLAKQTQGHFAHFLPDAEPTSIWDSLLAYHSQRHLVYLSATTQLESAHSRQIVVALQLDEQTPLSKTIVLPPLAANSADVQPAGRLVPTLEATPTLQTQKMIAAQNTPETYITTYITIPGINVSVPRGLLLLALPVLLALLLYLIYRELRERQRNRVGVYQPTVLKTSKNAQSENSIPLRPSSEARAQKSSRERISSEMQTQQPPNLRNTDNIIDNITDNIVDNTEEYEVNKVASRPWRPLTNGNRRPDKLMPIPKEIFDEEDDLVTVASLNFSDEEVTFRLSEAIEQPIIGKLVRASNNPHLPQQLPIYGLNPGIGQSRQIHVGRHSKNNAVVINDKAISREHAVLIQKEGRLYLRDNASSAGTYLNWRRLQPGEELLLRHNDLIGFGEICYEFHVKGEDEATIANP